MDGPPSRGGYHSVARHEDLTSSELHEDRNGQHAFRKDVLLSEKDSSSADDNLVARVDNGPTIWQKFNSYWVWELTACVVSMACLGIVIWTLVTLDGSPSSDWPFTIEPASFLSTFVTISRFTMLVGVAAGIAQLRWLYFLGGTRPLDHLDSFDSASRGPMGSVLFFFRPDIRGSASLVARLGAFIMVAALAMDPFTQQILKSYTELQSLPNHLDTWVLATNTSGGPNDRELYSDATRRRSVYNGLLGNTDPVLYNCQSGNCTWPDFASLGYDISCTDVSTTVIKQCVPGSGVLNVNCTTIQHTLPNSNLSLSLQNGSIAIDGNINGTKAYTLLQSNTTDSYPSGFKSPSIFGFFVAQMLIGRNTSGFDPAGLRNPSWNLTSCDVRYCSRVYRGTTVKNGILSDPVPQILRLEALSNSSCWNQQPPTCQEFTVVNKSAVPEGSTANYLMVVDSTPVSIRTLLDFDFNLTTTQQSSNSNSVSAVTGAYSLATGLFWNVNITTSFANVATSLSTYLRNTAAPVRIVGTLQVSSIYYDVWWGWFALPAALDLMGPIFLLCVIIYTAKGVNREKPIWKTNTLPLLMHGIQGYQRHGYAGAETTAAITRKAQQMRVQLRRNDDGEIRFVRT